MLSVSGTASDDIASAIETYKRGHPYKCDKDGIIDIGVGKVSFASFNLFFFLLIGMYKHHFIEKHYAFDCAVILQLSFTDSEVRTNTAAVLSAISTHRISTKGI